jgi:hypothetical protein
MRSSKEEAWAEETCSLRLFDENVTFAKMYGKLAAILTDKLQKGSVVDSIHAPSSEMAYPDRYGQRFVKPPDKPARHFQNPSSESSTYPRRTSRAASITIRVTAAKIRGIGQ